MIKYKFEKDQQGNITVRSKDGGTVVSSRGFYYSRKMVDLAIEECDNDKPKLILGGGIGWQAGYMAAKLLSTNPLSEFHPRVDSVEVNPGMIRHTKINKSLRPYVRVIQRDALKFLEEEDISEYSAVLYDLYEDNINMVYPYYSGFSKISQSPVALFNVITQSDLVRLIKQGIKFCKTIRIFGEVFGDHRRYKIKDISFSSSNKVVMMLRDKESTHGYINSQYIEISKNFTSLPESGTIPNQFISLCGENLVSLMIQ